jgi:hypothetical protein
MTPTEILSTLDGSLPVSGFIGRAV